MNLSATAAKAIEVYGGTTVWQNPKIIEAEVSVRGLAFTLKRRPVFNRAKIVLETARPFSKLTPIGKDSGVCGVLDGNNVRLEDANGNTIAERKNPREYFPFGRRLFWWDDLDMAYFANYAFWNYFTFPSLLLNPEIRWTEIKTGMLEAAFPETIPTHSPKQEFIFDSSTGLLLQHNYTAAVISKLATAAHVVKEHREKNGIIFPSRRIVTPRSGNGRALNRPVLIDITIHDFQINEI